MSNAAAGPRRDVSLEELKLANDIAMKWFEIHADQRMTMFRFFLTLVGLSIVGFAASIENSLPLIASIVGLFLIVSSICFKQLDRRTSQILKQAEDAMRIVGAQMAEKLGSSAINVAEAAESKQGIPSYRQMFGFMYWICGILGLIFVLVPLSGAQK